MSDQHNSLCTCGCCTGIQKLTPANVENLPGLSALHYRAGTHYSFKQSMIERLSANAATAKLTSRNDDDMAIASLDGWATVLDVLTFYQERIINEGYLRTATERLSVVELAKHISYKPGPGVAAGTFVAFSMNDTAGSPGKAVVDAGTKVQSIPEQDELPQIFETTEKIEAHVEWNAMKVQTESNTIDTASLTHIYFNGTATNLQPGDGVLIWRKDRSNNATTDFRRIKSVEIDTDVNKTKITWETGLAAFGGPVGNAMHPNIDIKVYAFRQRASLFGYNAPDYRTMSEEIKNNFDTTTTSFFGSIGEKIKASVEKAAVLRLLGGDNPIPDEWPEFTISEISGAPNVISLTGSYPKIIKGSWSVMTAPGLTDQVYIVIDVTESSRKNFTVASKTTDLKLDNNINTTGNNFNSQVRQAVVFAQSEELELAREPISNTIGKDSITLEKLIAGLTEKMKIIITGKRKRLRIVREIPPIQFTVSVNNIANRTLALGDSFIIVQEKSVPSGNIQFTLKDAGGYEAVVELVPNQSYTIGPSTKEDETVSELHTIKTITPGSDPTNIVLEEVIENVFDPATVAISANVAPATHGETKEETIGSGNASQVFQKFELKQTPLTYVSAATATGNKTTLEIRVNDVLWHEVPTLYGVSKNDRVYTTSIDDDGKVTVQFGDGIAGARLPSGTENVKAKYRVGIGLDGSVNAGQLTMLMEPKLGLNKVINPLPASGAQDPETKDKAKQNAPLTVLTMDRIVSLKDFEDFTRAFAGIAKASADLIWDGRQQIIYITIAAADQKNDQADLHTHLGDAIKAYGHTNTIVTIGNYAVSHFSVNAGIKPDKDYLFDKVKADVEKALADKFSFDARSFGQDVTASEVISIIQNVTGVLYTDLELLNGLDPFTGSNARIPAAAARVSGTDIAPAELLIIDPSQVTITEIKEKAS